MNAKSRSRTVRLFTLCIYGAMWLMAGIHAAVGTLQTDIIDWFSLSEAGKGVPSSFVSGFAIAAFAFVLLTGGRFRKAYVLLAGQVLGAAAAFAIGCGGGTYTLFLCLLVPVGFSTGITDALNSSILSELYPGDGAKMSLMHAVYGLAGFTMPFVFKFLCAGAWRRAYLIIGIAMFVLSFAAFAVLYRNADQIEKKPEKRDRVTLKTLLYVAKEPVLTPMYISMFTGGIYLHCMLVWSGRFIEFGHGSASLGAYVLSVVYLGITASRLTMSAVKPRMRSTLLWFMPFSAAFLVLAILVKNPVMALVCMFFSLFGYAPAIPFTLTLAGQADSGNRTSVTVSLMMLLLLGQALVSPLIGKAETAWGISNTMYIAAALELCAWAAVFAYNKQLEKGLNK